MLCIAAAVDCTHVHHVIHYKIIDCTYVGSATASFKDLVTLHRRHYSRCYGRRSATASFKDLVTLHMRHYSRCYGRRSATASFKDLVTLHMRHYSRCYGRRSATASFGLGNSWPGARTPQTNNSSHSLWYEYRHVYLNNTIWSVLVLVCYVCVVAYQAKQHQDTINTLVRVCCVCSTYHQFSPASQDREMEYSWMFIGKFGVF